jgi:hypothetical protein
MGIMRGMKHAQHEPRVALGIPHRVEVVPPLALSIEDLGGVGAIDWVTGTVKGYPIQVGVVAVHNMIRWYLSDPERATAKLPRLLPVPPAASPDGQPVARRRNPPRSDYREADALLHAQIEVMLAGDPKLTVTNATKRLIKEGTVQGSGGDASKLRRVVKGFFASRPEMRYRSG